MRDSKDFSTIDVGDWNGPEIKWIQGVLRRRSGQLMEINDMIRKINRPENQRLIFSCECIERMIHRSLLSGEIVDKTIVKLYSIAKKMAHHTCPDSEIEAACDDVYVLCEELNELNERTILYFICHAIAGIFLSQTEDLSVPAVLGTMTLHDDIDEIEIKWQKQRLFELIDVGAVS